MFSECMCEGRQDLVRNPLKRFKSRHCSLSPCEMEGVTEELKNLGKKNMCLVSGWRRGADSVVSKIG